MRITTKGRYALRALANLAATSDGRPKPIKTIAAEEHISPEFLEQIFFKMKKAGIINSVRGPGGGFTIEREFHTINVKEIFLAVEEGLDLTPCTVCSGLEAEDPCERMDLCLVNSVWQDASEHILRYFESITLASVLEQNHHQVELLRERRAEAARQLDE